MDGHRGCDHQARPRHSWVSTIACVHSWISTIACVQPRFADENPPLPLMTGAATRLSDLDGRRSRSCFQAAPTTRSRTGGTARCPGPASRPSSLHLRSSRSCISRHLPRVPTCMQVQPAGRARHILSDSAQDRRALPRRRRMRRGGRRRLRLGQVQPKRLRLGRMNRRGGLSEATRLCLQCAALSIMVALSAQLDVPGFPPG